MDREKRDGMVCIKANDEIVKVYQRIITAMRERVEWNGDIIIRKNCFDFIIYGGK